MSNNLTKKQEGFVRDYLESGNGRMAALKNYSTEGKESAASIAWENLQKPAIIRRLQESVEAARSMIYKLSQESEIDAIRLSASKDIMDRGGFKPVEKSEVSAVISQAILDPTNKAVIEKLREIQDELENN